MSAHHNAVELGAVWTPVARSSAGRTRAPRPPPRSANGQHSKPLLLWGLGRGEARSACSVVRPSCRGPSLLGYSRDIKSSARERDDGGEMCGAACIPRTSKRTILGNDAQMLPLKLAGMVSGYIDWGI